MPVNKVIYDGKTLIDISGSTVSQETIKKGKTAFNSAGVKIIGSMTPNYDLMPCTASINNVNGVVTTKVDGETHTASFSSQNGIDTIITNDGKITVESSIKNGIETIIEIYIPNSGTKKTVKKTVITPVSTGENIVTTVTEMNK